MQYPLTTSLTTSLTASLTMSLTDDEKNKAWDFLNNFIQIENLSNDWYARGNDIFAPFHYRALIIDRIRNKYSSEEFYVYETLVNRLYWNLKNALWPHVCDNLTKYNLVDELTITHGNSAMNSYTHFNENDHKYYKLDGISNLDEICMNIMMDRKKYDMYIAHPESIDDSCCDDDQLYLYYYMNYPFPNANPMFYNENNKSIWLEKINKMYYHDKENTRRDEYWYKLIKINANNL